MTSDERVTASGLAAMKARGEKVTMVTAYDFSSAILAERAGIDVVLVGDSLGMVVLGYSSTLPVTMDEMIHHTRAAARGIKRALLVGDMPFMSYHAGEEAAVLNAGRFLKEAGAHAVKLEGGRTMCPLVRRMTACGIPVMGHIGLTPQSINLVGGFRLQATTSHAAEALLEDALALQEAGAFAVVLELVPVEVAGLVSRRLSAPTIGIGSGPECDGQVLVFHDLLGLYECFVPRHTKQYARLGETAITALSQYRDEVRAGRFPSDEHSRRLKADEWAALRARVGEK